jgi:hypothetical protein
MFRKSKIPVYQEKTAGRAIRWGFGMQGNMSCAAMGMRAMD